MEYYYSVIQRNKISSHKKSWRKLKCKLLRERSNKTVVAGGSGAGERDDRWSAEDAAGSEILCMIL